MTINEILHSKVIFQLRKLAFFRFVDNHIKNSENISNSTKQITFTYAVSANNDRSRIPSIGELFVYTIGKIYIS